MTSAHVLTPSRLQHHSSASAAGSKPSSQSPSPSLVYNSINNAVWLKLPRGVGAAAAKALEKEGLKHPVDRLGNVSLLDGLFAGLTVCCKICNNI